jgi:4-hydroxybenzoate polyprenyltransferase
MAREARWSGLLRLMRIPNVFTALSNILAAQLIVNQGRPEWGIVAMLMLASACLYSGGIVLNDFFDYQEDSRDRPTRPLPSGAVSLPAAALLGFGLLSAGIGCAALAGTEQLVIAIIITVLILLYDTYAKHTVLGAPSMGLCRFGNWILGLSYGASLNAVWPLAIPVFTYVTSLTLLSRAETTAARRTPLILCAAGMVLTAASILALTIEGRLGHAWALWALAGAMLFVGIRLWKTLHAYTPQNVQLTIKTLVLGIIPLDAILALGGGPWWGGLLVLTLYLPGAWLARKTYVT